MSHISASTHRARTAGIALAAACAVAGSLVSGAAVAVAGINHGVRGKIYEFAVSGGYQIQELFAGSDGQVWFTTTQSQLGGVTAAGQANLTPVTLPHGNAPAVIAGAGPEGVWSYGNTTSTTPTSDFCSVALITPDDVIHNITLPEAAVTADSTCGGAVADEVGNLWVSLDGNCLAGCDVALIAEIMPAGDVKTFRPDRAGARPSAMTLGADGAIWVLEGNKEEEIDRYTAAGLSTSFMLSTDPRENGATHLLARPDGMFWFGPERPCVQLNADCPRFDVFDPATPVATIGNVLPVAITDPRSGDRTIDQFAVDPNSAVWMAGRELAGASDRLFRLNAVGGGVDRSNPLPLATDGTPLFADGTIAITPSGVVWASATSGSGDQYLLRLTPRT